LTDDSDLRQLVLRNVGLRLNADSGLSDLTIEHLDLYRASADEIEFSGEARWRDRMAAYEGSARRSGVKAAHQGKVLDTKNRVEYSMSGRAVRGEDGSATIAWPGSTATICFQGADASIDLTDSGQNQFAVLIDDKLRREKLIPGGGREKLELVRGLERGEHTIQLVRLTEASLGQTQIHGFILTQTLYFLNSNFVVIAKISG